MNKKGFTIAETLVTFVLVAFVGLTLLQLLLNYKDLAAIKIKQQTYAAIKDQITARIQKDIKTRQLLYITQKTPNSIQFIYGDDPSHPVTLTVHNISYSNDYDELNTKYIEYDGIKYRIPSGMPEKDSIKAYTDTDSGYSETTITDYSKYQGVNINMGRIYYEASPIKLSDDSYRTIYHVIVSIGVTDLEEDYGLNMVFVANTEGSNYKMRNLILNNSSFESTFYPQKNEFGYTDVDYNSYSITGVYTGETTCAPPPGAATNTAITANDGYPDGSVLPANESNVISCGCGVRGTCYLTLTDKPQIKKDVTYTFSYYYYTINGAKRTLADLGLTNVCCTNTGACRDCGTDTRGNEFSQESDKFSRIQYTFKSPVDGYLKLKFGFESIGRNGGRIVIDAIQLEEGTAASNYQKT